MSLSKVITKELIKSNAKYLNCYLPIYKPPGIDSVKLRESVFDDLHNVLWLARASRGLVPVNLLSKLDPYADGVMTFRIGHGLGIRRYMVFSENIYHATVEFGLEHHYNNIDGDFVARVEVDDLTDDDIQRELQYFINVNRQKSLPRMKISERIIDRSPNEVARIYNTIFDDPAERQTRPQMFKCCYPPKEVKCMDLKLLNYCKPYAELRITCQALFHVNAFIGELAERLGTKASLIRMTRIKEGPMWINDLRLLHIHELNLEHYILRVPSLLDSYRYYRPDMTSEQIELTEERIEKGCFTRYI